MEKIYAVKLKQQDNIQILNFTLQLEQALLVQISMLVELDYLIGS